MVPESMHIKCCEMKVIFSFFKGRFSVEDQEISVCSN